MEPSNEQWANSWPLLNMIGPYHNLYPAEFIEAASPIKSILIITLYVFIHQNLFAVSILRL